MKIHGSKLPSKKDCLLTLNKGLLTVDELQMWVFVGLLQVTRFWGIPLLGSTFDKKDKGDAKGFTSDI